MKMGERNSSFCKETFFASVASIATTRDAFNTTTCRDDVSSYSARRSRRNNHANRIVDLLLVQIKSTYYSDSRRTSADRTKSTNLLFSKFHVICKLNIKRSILEHLKISTSQQPQHPAPVNQTLATHCLLQVSSLL